MPGTQHIGISRRIEEPAERDRLRGIVEAERPAEGGLIVRTACEGVTKREIHDDVRFLTRLWARLCKQADGASAPALVHSDLDLVLRTVRDLFTSDVDRLAIDSPEDHARVVEFVSALMPRLASRVHLYEGLTPIFDQHGVETKINRALERRVWLKSGGYLIFDQTESLTTVDVNTGRYVGKKDQEETILKTNLEAAKQVVQQLRLRNIGGIIVIDFIDMEKAANRKKVFDALQEAVRKDKARANVLRISELGLVQMTRKRTRESLEQLLLAPCPHCSGAGRVRSLETLAYDALRRVQREAAGVSNSTRIALRVHPEVAADLDKARANVLRISELGLVQMTRKRTRESLEQLLLAPCPHCSGAGRVRSLETLAYDALRRVQREAAGVSNSTRIALRVHPEVAAFLTDPQRRSVEALERLVGRTVAVEAAPELQRDEIDARPCLASGPEPTRDLVSGRAESERVASADRAEAVPRPAKPAR